ADRPVEREDGAVGSAAVRSAEVRPARLKTEERRRGGVDSAVSASGRGEPAAERAEALPFFGGRPRTGVDRGGDQTLRRGTGEGGRPTRDQPQHAAQEARPVRAGGGRRERAGSRDGRRA